MQRSDNAKRGARQQLTPPFFSLLHVCQTALRPFTLIRLPMIKFLASVVYKRADVRCRNVQRICQVPSHCPSKTLRLSLFFPIIKRTRDQSMGDEGLSVVLFQKINYSHACMRHSFPEKRKLKNLVRSLRNSRRLLVYRTNRFYKIQITAH